MKLSLYTFVRNGLRLDYHVVPMLKYHAKLFDEIVVLEGYSSDGTYEAISSLDSKIRVFRAHLGPGINIDWYANAKEQARKLCTGDWCVLLDTDEFFPEWEVERLRNRLQTEEEDLLGVHFLHFYGNYKVHVLPEYAKFGYRIHRNLADIEVWGDGANVRRNGFKLKPHDENRLFDVHHFGEVRYAARLREKWRAQARRHKSIAKRDWLPRFMYDLLPHRWCDPLILPRVRVYNGPYISAVQEAPQEFVRDNFKAYQWAIANGAPVEPVEGVSQCQAIAGGVL